MKNMILITVVLTLSLTTTIGHTDPIPGTDAEVKAVAGPILDNILEGFKYKDYTKYSRDLDDTVKETVTKEKFPTVCQQVQQQVGVYKSRKYLGSLKKGKMTVVLWKGRFDGTDDDVVIKLVISKRGQKYFVTGLWFQ